MTANAKRICVFAGSSPGARPEYVLTAKKLGEELCEHGYDLVYGGGHVGLMGAVADGVLANGGKAIGIIPEALADKELAHRRLTELHVVASMHDRKALMADLSDAFVALPGGLGTLEELAEMLTWGQLGIHHKPCAVLNVDGYYDGLMEFLAHAVRERFLQTEHVKMILVDTDPASLLEQIATYEAPMIDKWLDLELV